MSHYSVRDLGSGFSPWRLNRLGDVVGRQFPSSGSEWLVNFADGNKLPLPAEIASVMDISDDGIVLAWRQDTNAVLLFDTKTGTSQPFAIPGFPYLFDVAMDYLGNLAGTAGTNQNASSMRGFLWNHKTHALDWLYATNVPLPPGATPFLELHDRNIYGHATGVQGWLRGLEQAIVPIYFDGLTIQPIGSYTFIANGIRITNNNRVSAWYYPQNGPEYRAIYDGATNTLVPFGDGRIVDLNAAGETLWESAWPEDVTYVTDITGTYPLDLAFPAGSGWSSASAARMNDAGVIVGFGQLGKEGHGYALMPVQQPIRGREKEIVATILWGIINDAGGVEIIGGHLRHVPPRGPLDALLEALPPELRTPLSDAIASARLDDSLGARSFASQARGIVENYRRQNRFGW